MRDLKWNELDVIECLGALSVFDEENVIHRFVTERDEFVLEVDICAYNSFVEVRLNKSRSRIPVFDTSFFVLEGIRHIKEKDLSWLEFSDCLVAPVTFDEESFAPRSSKTYASFQIQMLPQFRLRFF
jgi:hypothetical protein